MDEGSYRAWWMIMPTTTTTTTTKTITITLVNKNNDNNKDLEHAAADGDVGDHCLDVSIVWSQLSFDRNIWTDPAPKPKPQTHATAAEPAERSFSLKRSCGRRLFRDFGLSV